MTVRMTAFVPGGRVRVMDLARQSQGASGVSSGAIPDPPLGGPIGLPGSGIDA